MSDNFRQFGPAARLYAENFAVVDEMWKAFLDDISTFHDALREKINSTLATSHLGEEVKNTTRSWWITEEEDDEDEGDEDGWVPYIWFSTSDPQLVSAGRLQVTAGYQGSDESTKQTITSLPQKLRLPPYSKFSKGGLFTVVISCATDDAIIDKATEPLLKILTALNDAEKERKQKATLASKSKGPRSRKQ
ncbi:MAG TPA: hypothetical protein VIM11_02755 [Tepidisphaeraceae bacterium]|jgi:hypothetical protein